VSTWRGAGNREVPRVFKEEGGTWGKPGFPHGSEPRASDVGVTLYRAEGCQLCEEAHDVLREVQPEFGFKLTLVDIDGDPVLEERYRLLLPAVEIDGRLAFTYFVEPAELRACLVSMPEPA
jgi:glutaredoxin